MKVATIPKKRRRDLIIIAILLIGIPLLVFASYQVYQLVIRASVEAQPKNVALSNVTTSSVTISWVTDVSATGSVVPVLNNVEQSPVLDKRGSGKRYTHYVELTNLEPNTDYQFVIVSDNNKYSGQGEDIFTFKTAPIKDETPTPNPIHGSVSGASGDDVMLFAMLKDKSAYPVSAIMPRGGNWIMDISSLRSVSDKSLARVVDSTNIVLVAISDTESGAVVEGTYSELFDSNGRLKDTFPLNISQQDNLLSHFPSQSILSDYSEVVPDLGGEDIVERNPLLDRDYEDFDSDLEIEDKEGEEFTRRFRLVSDIEWIDMVTEGGTVVSRVTGEPSIQIANLTDIGFSVIWVSEEREEGYIRYGTSLGSLDLEGNDERDGITNRETYFVHIVSLSRLEPETEYFFEVVSGSSIYDNSGSKYSVTTFPSLSSPPPIDSVSGKIDGVPEHNEAVVVAQIKDADGGGSQGESSKIATVVNENGRWILSIADIRTQEGLSYFEYTSGDSLEIDVITTFFTSIYTENISEEEIVISLSSSTSGENARIELLDNYGVLGYSTGQSLDTRLTQDVQGQTQDTLYARSDSQETPKTGVLDKFLTKIILSFAIITGGIVLFTYSNKKKDKSNKMAKNV
jgi:hypothetical protein